MEEVKEWYSVDNIEEVDSPALLIYKERVIQNIERAKEIAGGDVDRLRPHVKTHKIKEVCTLMLEAGIRKFKCATIAEAEMLAMAGAPDVLLAYQLTGPKIKRFGQLIKAYPETNFACLVDEPWSMLHLSEMADQEDLELNVYIDLNVGMNRTGVNTQVGAQLSALIFAFPRLEFKGYHAYDGHIHTKELLERTRKADKAVKRAFELRSNLQPFIKASLALVVGGTPTFPVHIQRENCECSPGTFVFWDKGYADLFPEMPFEWAALVVSRVISIVDKTHICTDLGYKSVAAESPLPRVHFLNAPEAKPVKQSEEHLVLKVSDSKNYKRGQVLYGVPVHICPTVALYDKACVIEDGKVTTEWDVIARNRKITV